MFFLFDELIDLMIWSWNKDSTELCKHLFWAWPLLLSGCSYRSIYSIPHQIYQFQMYQFQFCFLRTFYLLLFTISRYCNYWLGTATLRVVYITSGIVVEEILGLICFIGNFNSSSKFLNSIFFKYSIPEFNWPHV